MKKWTAIKILTISMFTIGVCSAIFVGTRNFRHNDFIKKQDGNYYKIVGNKVYKGLLQQGDDFYYFDDNDGKQIFGFQYDENNKPLRYFDKQTGKMVVGLKKIGKNTRYFDEENGLYVTGLYTTTKGDTYFFDNNNGIMKTGFINDQGNTYYADPNTGLVNKGWFEINGNRYYGDPLSGSLAKGFITLDGKDLYFSPNSHILEKGWIRVDNNNYYIDDDYNLLKNTKKNFFGHELSFNEIGVCTNLPDNRDKKVNEEGIVSLNEYLGFKPEKLIQWLSSHENDDYYLDTPYAPYDNRNPRGDDKVAYGTADKPNVCGMNCTGFVWHALHKASEASGVNKNIPGENGWVTMITSNNIKRSIFNSKEEMMTSAILRKGDIIWMFREGDLTHAFDDHHVGIFWGNNPLDDRFWHSSFIPGLNKNALTPIMPCYNGKNLFMVIHCS